MINSSKTIGASRAVLLAAAWAAAGLLAGSVARATSAGAAAGIKVDKVARGSALITQAGSNTVIRASNGAIIDFTSFNLTAGKSATFVQPSASSRVLNRIDSGVPSSLDGTLSANGIVYFLNPSGVVFGPHATINAAQFVAGATNMTDSDFVAGHNYFSSAGATLTNQGSIHADDVILVGEHVANAGSIVSTSGLVLMQSGDGFYVGDGGSSVRVKLSGTSTASATTPAVANTGTITAPKVVLGAGDIYSFAISQTGTIKSKNVTLSASGGTVAAAGSIDVSNAKGTGGSVAVLGTQVVIAGAAINASGSTSGGTILVGGDEHGKGVVPTAQETLVTSASTLDASATQTGNGGKVIVWSDKETGFYGTINAKGGKTGGNGGFVETSGALLDTTGGVVNASAPHGKAGTWLLDPAGVIIDDGDPADTMLTAYSSNTVIVFNSASTDFVTTSSTTLTPLASQTPTATTVTYSSGTAAALEAAGKAPPAPDSSSYTDSNVFALPTGAPAAVTHISATQIDQELNAGSDVLIATDSPAAMAVAGTGAITVIAPISKTAGPDAMLTLQAFNGITIAANITSTVGRLNVILNGWTGGSASDLTQDGSAGVTFPQTLTIATNGGDFIIQDGLVLANAAIVNNPPTIPQYNAGVGLNPALNAGSNVSVSTAFINPSSPAPSIANPQSPGFPTFLSEGTIYLDAPINKTAGSADVNLSMEANYDILDSDTISAQGAGSSPVGALNISMITNHDNIQLGFSQARMQIVTNGGSFTANSHYGFQSYFEDSNPDNSRYGDATAPTTANPESRANKTIASNYKPSNYFGLVFYNTPIDTSGGDVTILAGRQIQLGSIDTVGAGGVGGNVIAEANQAPAPDNLTFANNPAGENVVGFEFGYLILQRENSITAGTGDVTLEGAPVLLTGNTVGTSISGGKITITAEQSPETYILNTAPTTGQTLPNGNPIPSTVIAVGTSNYVVYFDYRLTSPQIVVNDPVDQALEGNSGNPYFIGGYINTNDAQGLVVSKQNNNTGTTVVNDFGDNVPPGAALVTSTGTPVAITGFKGETVSENGFFYTKQLGTDTGVVNTVNAGMPSNIVVNPSDITPISKATVDQKFSISGTSVTLNGLDTNGLSAPVDVRLYQGYTLDVKSNNGPIQLDGSADGQGYLSLDAGSGTVDVTGALGYVGDVQVLSGGDDPVGYLRTKDPTTGVITVAATSTPIPAATSLQLGLPQHAYATPADITSTVSNPVPLKAVSVTGSSVTLGSVVSTGPVYVHASQAIAIDDDAAGKIPVGNKRETALVTKGRFNFNQPVEIKDFDGVYPIAASTNAAGDISDELYLLDNRSLQSTQEASVTDVTPRVADLNAVINEFIPDYGTPDSISASPNPLSVASAIAGAVPQVERNPEIVATVSGSVAKDLYSLGVYARDVTPAEQFDALIGRALYDDIPRTPAPNEEDYKVASARLQEESAKQALAVYRDLFLKPVIDPRTNEPVTDARGNIRYQDQSPKIKHSLETSLADFKARNRTRARDMAAFSAFIQTAPAEGESRAYLMKLRELFDRVHRLGLTSTEQRVSDEVLMRNIIPNGLKQSDLEKIIFAPATAQ